MDNQQPTVQVNNAPQASGDHDLLIQIATKLDRAILDIKELKDGTTERVSALEEEKVSVKEYEENKTNNDLKLEDHEARLRFGEKYIWIALGALAILNLYFAYKQAFSH
jgi:hypothetical protein